MFLSHLLIPKVYTVDATMYAQDCQLSSPTPSSLKLQLEQNFGYRNSTIAIVSMCQDQEYTNSSIAEELISTILTLPEPHQKGYFREDEVQN
jgi:hypothetical protein